IIKKQLTICIVHLLPLGSKRTIQETLPAIRKRMDIKNLDINPYVLSEKVIENGNNSFKLWLEFEISTPWNDVENDFSNIIVDTLDGRNYGINVWTFKFLESSIKQDKENGENLNGLYQIPPDLFVKELTRNCIEKTIADLLENGNLEESLNNSIFELKFLDPYWDTIEMEEKSIQEIMNELKLELPENHLLHNENTELIAKKTNNDDIVLELEDERIAVVHLSWKSKKEIDGYPLTRVYKDKADFWNQEMKQDILEFKK
uniref:hypothetical protein n=1 Tax=uncultured Aquimarina sp. TaxID=575652 RepID=UPI0026136245